LHSKYQPNPPKVKLTFDDIAMYQYTGGTTGVSKGVILTHGNLSKQVQQLTPGFRPLEEDGNHAGRSALFPCLRTVLFHEFIRFRGVESDSDSQAAATTAAGGDSEYKPTFAPLVPTMYIGMLNHPDLKKTDMSCIKGAFSGSAPSSRGGHS
jgi:long-chain acyl-CoA synthetase